jgi:pimeloyl-ACP methyl ester carboxylesterase
MTKDRFIARTSYTLGIFRDHETDWVFKRTLEYMSEKAAELGECLSTAHKIEETDIESWIRAWSEVAEKVENLAEESLKKGNNISARESFLRACNYYRTAEYGAPPTHPRFHELWEKSRNCFHRACSLFDPPIQIIEVPFEGRKLPGYFWRPDKTDTKRPTLFAVGGNDSSGEEVAVFAGPAAVRRGYNFFTFEFPGHRGAVHLYPDCIKRPDYEVPFKAAFDFLEKLPGVDERIALTGFSFGGYVVSRVAAHDDRVRAVIPNSPIVDPIGMSLAFSGVTYKMESVAELLDRRPLILRLPEPWLVKLANWKLRKSPITRTLREYSSWSSGTLNMGMQAKLEMAVSMADDYNITRDLHKITCPALALVSENEGEILLDQAREFHENELPRV